MLSEDVLTPTEKLVLEVLIARRRLGEAIWTFEKDCSKQIKSMSDKGFVNHLHGVIENTIRASLTEEAFAQFCSFDYIPPIARNDSEAAEVFRKITNEAKTVQERLNNK